MNRCEKRNGSVWLAALGPLVFACSAEPSAESTDGGAAALPGMNNESAGGAANENGAAGNEAEGTEPEAPVGAGGDGQAAGGAGTGPSSPVGAGGGPVTAAGGTGNGAGGSGSVVTPPDGTATTFACSETEVPDSLPLRRLSYTQYRNTIEDLVTFAVPSSADVVLSALAPTLDGLPHDSRQGPDTTFALFDRLDQTVQQRHVDEQYALAQAVGAELTNSEERLSELVGACAIESSDAACMDAFVARFGERAQRRAITADDLEFYRLAAGEAPYAARAYADVTALLLASPYLTYMVEHGTETASGTRLPLSAFELASRLSYQFWQTLPDEELFAAARSGELLTDAGYETQLDRVLADARAERGIAELVGQWLENPMLEPLDARVDEAPYAAFLNGFEPSSELKARMQQEVVDAALYYVRTDGSFADFFGSDRSFATTDDLASIYGVAPWDGAEPPLFSEPERSGLLTRAALLATGLTDTRPIIKGVMIRKAILCDDVPPPPAEVANSPPPLADDLASTRQAVEAKTATGACAVCHVNLINPLGFATENFDALGRLRSEQPLFDEDGNIVGNGSVDTTSVPRVELSDMTASAGADDLTRLILASDKPYACFARQYFRFTFSRMEDASKDGCALASVKDKLVEGESLRDVLKTIALDRSFRERTF